MESEEDTEDEGDVSMYEKKVGCDLFLQPLCGYKVKNMTASFGLGAGTGAHHYAKRDDTEPQKDIGPGKSGIYDKNILQLV